MMLMIPLEPSASYLADGEVITSTLLIWSAGMAFSASAILPAMVPDGFPLIKTVMPVLPRKETFPSKSTESRGTFRRTSVAFPPAIGTSFSAL